MFDVPVKSPHPQTIPTTISVKTSTHGSLARATPTQKPEKRYKNSRLHMKQRKRQCHSPYHQNLVSRWTQEQSFLGFDFVLYCHLRYEKCPRVLSIDQEARRKIEHNLMRTFLVHFQTFSQQWRLLRAYAFGRFWQVKTGGVEFLRIVRQIIESHRGLANQLSQICAMILKTLEWNRQHTEDPPWVDCQLHDAASIANAFDKHSTPVSLIKYIYHGFNLHIPPKELDDSLLLRLFEKLSSNLSIRDVWLVLGYHLAGCFWGNKKGCVEYLEYFTQCVFLLGLQDDPTWAVKFTQLLSLVHGLAYQNRNVITKSLREGFHQKFYIMDQQIYRLCAWHVSPQGQQTLTIRHNCRKSLKQMINSIFPEYSVVEYGSTRLKLDYEYSDLDIALVPYKLTIEDDIDSVIPIKECQDANIKLADRLTAVTMIETIQREMKKRPELFVEVRVFPNARVPLLRCKYVNSVTVDVSVHSNEHLFNNILTIWSIIECKTPLQHFLIAVKCWAKKFDLVRPFHGTINSHGWTMLAIFTWKLLTDDSKMSGVTAGECFVKFFRLFRDFDYKSKAISIREIQFVNKLDANVVVEFEGLYGKENVCRHVTLQGAELIFGCIRFTDRYLNSRPLKDATSQSFLPWLDTLKADFDKAHQPQPQTAQMYFPVLPAK